MTSYQDQAVAYLKGEMSEEERTAFEEALVTSEELRVMLEKSRELLDLLSAAEETSIIRRVNAIIVQGIHRGASAIHLVPEREEAVILLRIDGVLHEAERFPRDQHQPLVDRWKIMADMNVAARRFPQDGRIPVRHDGRDYDLRVSVLPSLYGERVTARILNRSEVLIGLERLGLTPAQAAALRRLAERPSGLIAAAGGADSGKTTLVYSLLLHIRDATRTGRNIMTVEDPVEYQLSGVTQTAVDRRAGLTYESALRSVFRSDPDVVFVAAMRSLEVAELAMEMALTGRLVLTTLHAPDAPGVIQHLRDLGAPNLPIARTLAGAIALRLVRKVCPDCAAEYQPSPEDLQKLGLSAVEDGPFRRGAGCAACGNTGFLGRLPLVEILEVDDVLRRQIAENAPWEALWDETFARGPGSLWDDARAKVRQGLTTVEEVAWALFDYPQPPVTAPLQEPFFLPSRER